MNLKNFGTGFFNHTEGAYGRLRDEASAIGDLFDKGKREQWANDSAAISGKVAGGGLSDPQISALNQMNPSFSNGAMNSFLSSGAMKTAATGAGAGAIYGAFSDNTSILGGAIKGSILGAIGKGVTGIGGEMRSIGNAARSEVSKW